MDNILNYRPAAFFYDCIYWPCVERSGYRTSHLGKTKSYLSASPDLVFLVDYVD